MKCAIAYQPDIYINLSQKKMLQNVIISGILYKRSQLIRDYFQQLVFFIAANIAKNSPMLDLLGSLLSAKSFLCETECNELCETVLLLLDMYKEYLSQNEISKTKITEICTVATFGDFMHDLREYQSKETVSGDIPDNTLLSLLRITEKLATLTPIQQKLTTSERLQLIDIIYDNFLFPVKNTHDALYRFKCKSSKSREAAYKLIDTLSQSQSECAIHLLKDCIIPLRSQVTEIPGWRYEPEKQEKSMAGFVGIRNPGSICYMNSMLQQFFIIQPLRNALLSANDKRLPCINKEGIDDNMLHQMQTVFAFLQLSCRRDVNTANFCYSYKERDGKPTNVNIQHDAHEFLTTLFDRLERTLKDTSYNLLLQNIFGGKSCSQIICSNCGNVSPTFEDFYCLSLEVKNQKSIYDALDRYITSGSVSGYLCSECNKRCDVSKRMLLSQLPNVLIVHLQRFSYNFDIDANEKIHSRFEFPNVLDMTNYTEEGIEQAEDDPEKAKKIIKVDPNKKQEKMKSQSIAKTSMVEQEKKQKEENQPVAARKKQKKSLKPKDYYTYKLVGVVVHNGNADAGHYYSIINVNRDEKESESNYLETEKDRWVEFNDSHISEFNFNRLESECFGGDEEDSMVDDMTDEAVKFVGGRSKSAYMLIYERQLKHPIPERIESEVMIREEEDIMVNSIENEDLFKITKGLREGKKVFYKDTLKNTMYQMHNFYKVPLSIQSLVQAEVIKDNIRYLFERLIYNQEFVKFAFNTFINAYNTRNFQVSVKLQDEIGALLTQFYTQFFLEIFPHCKLTGIPDLLNTIKIFSDFFSINSGASKELLFSSIKDPSRTYALMVKCPETIVRQYSTKICTNAFLKVLSEEQKDFINPPKDTTVLSRHFMDMCLSFIGYDLANNWTKFRYFFEMLKFMVVYGNELPIQYMFERNFIATTLDFMLGNLSPLSIPSHKRYEMGNQAQEPEFSSLIELVAFLMNSVIIQTPEIPDEKLTEKISKQKLYVLKFDDPAVKCLQSEEIILKYGKCGGKAANIASMISKIAYYNTRYSKHIITLILKNLNEIDLHRAAMWLDFIPELIMLDDNLQNLRIEWILGYPQIIRKNEFGLANTTDIEDDIYEYVSFIGNKKHYESLLQLIWKHRKRSEPFTICGIRMLFRLMATCEALYSYMMKIIAPSYTNSSYINWMSYAVNLHLSEQCSDKQLTPEQSEKLQAANDAKILIDQFAKKMQSGEYAEPVNTGYMVGKKIGKDKIIKEWNNSGKGVKVEIVEITTEIFPSKPCGNNNFGVTPEFLIKYFFNFSYQ